MAHLRGYFDESETLGSVSGVAGWVGAASQWDRFDRAWNAALKAEGLEYLHMREPWMLERSQHRDRLIPSARAIENADLFGVGHFVVTPHLQTFNSERGCCVEAYPLALFGCLLELAHQYPDGLATIVDRATRLDEL
jgi:hypothetical protein